MAPLGCGESPMQRAAPKITPELRPELTVGGDVSSDVMRAHID